MLCKWQSSVSLQMVVVDVKVKEYSLRQCQVTMRPTIHEAHAEITYAHFRPMPPSSYLGHEK
jgi:uncharacterized metal-binding protein YceD (DUF177 family)